MLNKLRPRLVDRHEAERARLEVQVIRCGRAAIRAVIEERIPASELLRDAQHVRERMQNPLRNVLLVRDREVLGEDREWVAEDDVVAGLDPSLRRRKILEAQKALALGNRLLVDLRRRRRDASRVELHLHREVREVDLPHHHRIKGAQPLLKHRPGFRLLPNERMRLIRHVGSACAIRCQVIARKKPRLTHLPAATFC